MEINELDLSNWRDVRAPDSMAAKALSKPRMFRSSGAIRFGLVCIAVVAMFLLFRPNSAEATLTRMNERFRSVDTLWIDTETFVDGSKHAERGVTIIAHGANRRDGLRGMRGYRGPKGKWTYNPVRNVVYEDKEAVPFRFTPQVYASESLIAGLKEQGGKCSDMGKVTLDGNQFQLLEIEWKTGSDQIWIDPQTNLPMLIKQFRGEDGDLTGTCRFRYDIKIDPGIMTPSALSSPLKALVKPWPTDN